MPIVADAAAAIRADMTGFQSDLKKGLAGSEKQVQGFGAKLSGMLSPKNLLMGAGAAFAGGQVLSFMSDAVNSAAEFNDSVAATGVIFGEDMIPAMEEWGDKAASTFGASKQEALSAANVIATLGKSAGLAGDDLVGFSQEMVTLGGDLASMFGGTTQDAITAVGAALRGESEPIRRYGVLLDDATLRQKAFEMGLIDTTKNALTPQQRVLAAQAEILEQTTDAQGDFMRTSDGMANTQRELAAEFENVNIEIGEKLMPIALEFARFVKDVLIPALSFLADNVLGPVADGIGNLAQGFKDAAGDVHFFAMNFGDQGDAIHKTADRFGEDFDDLKDRVRDRMVETGESFEEAHGVIVRELEAASTEGQAAAWEMMQGIYSAAVEGTRDLEKQAHEMAAVVPREIRARWQDTRQAAFQTAIEHAKGILDGQNQVKVAFEVLTQLQEEEQTRAQRISYLQGLLSSQELSDGLNDGRPGVRGAANATRAAIVAELAGLGVDAYNSGLGIPRQLAAGMYANAHLLDGASSYLASKVSGYLPRSEPKEGPLRGITKVGHAIVTSITDGIWGSLGTADRAAAALAGALVPSLGTPALATAGLPAATGGVTYQYILNVSGRDPVAGSREEVLDLWDQTAAFTDRGTL